MLYSSLFSEMERYITELQTTICDSIVQIDSTRTLDHKWNRPDGGGGFTRVIENGAIIEKGGVNISSIFGNLPKEIAKQLKVEPMEFAACGLSLILHPRSPRIPSIHMNVRYFEMEDGNSWFGGGTDLTPYYPHQEDFVLFHKTLQEACESVLSGSYEQYKCRADEYFYLPHRQEMRGIGGIFFDYLKDDNEKHFKLIQAVGNSFLPSYIPILKRRKDEEFSEGDQQFQQIRRGRYVEFNLLYDRGTMFGLKSQGRVESIFISLPPTVQFQYDWHAREGTPQEEMTEYYQPKDWVAQNNSI